MAKSVEQATGTKKTARKRRRKRKPENYASYVMAIEDWDWALNFSSATSRFDRGVYSDYRHLHLRGPLLIPSRLKIASADVFLMPAPIADAEAWTGEKPESVGGVETLRGGRFEALLTMPLDALPSVLSMLIAGKFKFIDMHGERLFRRRARIHGYRLEMDIEPEDMPVDE